MQELEELLAGLAQRVEERQGVKVAIVEPSRLREAAERLREAGYDYLLMVSGVDEPKQGRMRIVYHITRSSNPSELVALEVMVPRDDPRVPSVYDIYPAAQIQEREEHEMLGIVFEGNPDLRHLLLPEDWPEGVYPLRKDFHVAEEPYISSKPSKPIWVLKPELKPGGEAGAGEGGGKG
ncbi:hypothetical protein CF15_04680 [Pyrodictium occultum]|uniref:NADH:ubiquinone oxidoreductase 30kDa subunit domain-containing protein n=1 Tax=Pyrodictium occultum TaxID=2309 RepID=A0A0V8RVJ6_PYROC|nr:NADH-quinone oxidoreductase subunit C [Pyrodictium occultum]KSW12076.1 hypothetical protein CF15_04680 [Pyrodictium occultum]